MRDLVNLLTGLSENLKSLGFTVGIRTGDNGMFRGSGLDKLIQRKIIKINLIRIKIINNYCQIGNSGGFYGKAASLAEGKITLAADACWKEVGGYSLKNCSTDAGVPGGKTGHAVLILAGPSKGQWRRVAGAVSMSRHPISICGICHETTGTHRTLQRDFRTRP